MVFYIKDKMFLIDDEDSWLLEKHTWHLNKKQSEDYIYAFTWISSRENGKKKQFHASLHRMIMNCPKDKLVDHINGNTKDNRKCNLRITDRFGNQKNSKMNVRNKTGVKGVSYNPDTKKYCVSICSENRSMNLGRYNTLEDAAKAYEEASIKYHKEYRRII